LDAGYCFSPVDSAPLLRTTLRWSPWLWLRWLGRSGEIVPQTMAFCFSAAFRCTGISYRAPTLSCFILGPTCAGKPEPTEPTCADPKYMSNSPNGMGMAWSYLHKVRWAPKENSSKDFSTVLQTSHQEFQSLARSTNIPLPLQNNLSSKQPTTATVQVKPHRLHNPPAPHELLPK